MLFHNCAFDNRLKVLNIQEQWMRWALSMFFKILRNATNLPFDVIQKQLNIARVGTELMII